MILARSTARPRSERRHVEHRSHRLGRLDEVLGGAQLEAGLLGEVARSPGSMYSGSALSPVPTAVAPMFCSARPSAAWRIRDRAPAGWSGRRRRTPGRAGWARRPACACGPISARRRTPRRAPRTRPPARPAPAARSRDRSSVRDAHRRREGVVRRLRHVDVVVGADDRVVAAPPAADAQRAQDLDGPVGEHLVGVHVVADAGAGLEGSTRKLSSSVAWS